MKKDIHPKNYRKVIFEDISTGSQFLVGSTIATDDKGKYSDGKEYPRVKVEISSASHPFYTGKQKLVDTAGMVDKFRAKQKAAEEFAAAGPKKKKKKKKKIEIEYVLQSPDSATKQTKQESKGTKDQKPKAEKKAKKEVAEAAEEAQPEPAVEETAPEAPTKEATPETEAPAEDQTTEDTAEEKEEAPTS